MKNNTNLINYNNIFSIDSFILMIEMIKFPKTYRYIENCIAYVGIYIYFLTCIFWITISGNIEFVKQYHNTFLFLYSFSKILKIYRIYNLSYFMWFIYVLLFNSILKQYQSYIQLKNKNLIYFFDIIFGLLTFPLKQINNNFFNLIRFICLFFLLILIIFIFFKEINNKITIIKYKEDPYEEKNKFKLSIFYFLKIIMIFSFLIFTTKYIIIYFFILKNVSLLKDDIKKLNILILIIEIFFVLLHFICFSKITFELYFENERNKEENNNIEKLSMNNKIGEQYINNYSIVNKEEEEDEVDSSDEEENDKKKDRYDKE